MPITVTISSDEASVAGSTYTITCTVSVIQGFSASPDISWRDSNDDLILPGETISIETQIRSDSVTDVMLTFNPLHTRDEGVYKCVAEAASFPFTVLFNASVTQYIDVETCKY